MRCVIDVMIVPGSAIAGPGQQLVGAVRGPFLTSGSSAQERGPGMHCRTLADCHIVAIWRRDMAAVAAAAAAAAAAGGTPGRVQELTRRGMPRPQAVVQERGPAGMHCRIVAADCHIVAADHIAAVAAAGRPQAGGHQKSGA
eukprot:COSAG05_NODE_995_length_6259_cov_2.194805_2_plen_142_part_00